MDKWIRDIVDKYYAIIFENPNYTRCGVSIKRLSKGFRRFVSDHLFYYEKMTSKVLGDSAFNFVLVYRSTPFKFDVDFYYGVLYIYVLVDDSKNGLFDKILIGKFLISDFLCGFVSGSELDELDEIQSQYDQFEIPF